MIKSGGSPERWASVQDICSHSAQFGATVDAQTHSVERSRLHPYLHWASSDGRTVRGRIKVMAMLAERDPPLWPTSVEVRDDQIYRWQEPPDRVTSWGRD